jgi:hypothetical protein
MCGVQDDDQLFMEMLHIPLTQRTCITLVLSSPVDLVKYVGDYRSLTVRCHWIWQVKGQGLYAFVVLVDGVTPSDALKKEIMDCVRREVFSTLIK